MGLWEANNVSVCHTTFRRNLFRFDHPLEIFPPIPYFLFPWNIRKYSLLTQKDPGFAATATLLSPLRPPRFTSRLPSPPPVASSPPISTVIDLCRSQIIIRLIHVARCGRDKPQQPRLPVIGDPVPIRHCVLPHLSSSVPSPATAPPPENFPLQLRHLSIARAMTLCLVPVHRIGQ